MGEELGKYLLLNPSEISDPCTGPLRGHAHRTLLQEKLNYKLP